MKYKNIITVFLISFILASCAPATIVVPIKTAVPTSTFTLIPQTPTITSTLDPMANAPKGTTGFDKATGEPIREVIYEDRQTFTFHLSEQGEWVRVAGEFPLMDIGQWNYVPFRINISEDVPGGSHILQIIYADSTDDNNRPITTRIRNFFLTRLGLSSNDPEYYRLVNEEMDKGSESDARLPIITSDGEKTEIILSNVNGLSVTIDSAENLKKFFEAGRAVQWFDGYGGIYYLRVIVDKNNNAVCTVASEISLEELNDRALRNFIFSCVSHVFTQEDQREFLNYSNMQFLASASADTVESTGEQNVEIKYK